MMKFNWPKFNEGFSVKDATILLALAGSKSYGTNHPLSDTDYKGILIEPQELFMSPFEIFEQTMWKGDGVTGRVSEIDGTVEADEEGTIFGIDKFFKLASSCNPNVVELLFVDDKHIVQITEAGRLLRENRKLFLSQRALKTFTGYALSQLKRIKTHKNWIDRPPYKKPSREEHGLPPEKAIGHDQLNAAIAFIKRNTEQIAPWLIEVDNQHQGAFWESLHSMFHVLLEESGIERDFNAEEWVDVREAAYDKVATSMGFDDNFLEYLRKEKAYAQKMQHYKQYNSWLKNRNPARAELESKYGYDCKHALHLVRLLRMGGEILRGGDFKVFRPDRKGLLEIRNGKWPYEKLVEWADQEVEQLYSLVREGKANVPESPDYQKLTELAIEVKTTHWK